MLRGSVGGLRKIKEQVASRTPFFRVTGPCAILGYINPHFCRSHIPHIQDLLIHKLIILLLSTYFNYIFFIWYLSVVNSYNVDVGFQRRLRYVFYLYFPYPVLISFEEQR